MGRLALLLLLCSCSTMGMVPDNVYVEYHSMNDEFDGTSSTNRGYNFAGTSYGFTVGLEWELGSRLRHSEEVAWESMRATRDNLLLDEMRSNTRALWESQGQVAPAAVTVVVEDAGHPEMIPDEADFWLMANWQMIVAIGSVLGIAAGALVAQKKGWIKRKNGAG